jgi:hypothetical protein
MIERPKVSQSALVSNEEFYQHSRSINRLSEEEYVANILYETLNEGSGINITVDELTNLVTIAATGSGPTGADGILDGGLYLDTGLLDGGVRA